jgi:hypothetical protein
LTASIRATGARDRGKGQVRMLEMLPCRIGMVHGERAARTKMVRVRREHEVIYGELAVLSEQVAERADALNPVEGIVLLDAHPRQLPPLGAQRVERVGHRALLLKQSLAGGQPLLA